MCGTHHNPPPPPPPPPLPTFHTGGINNFVHIGVISVQPFQIKSSFSCGKKQLWWNRRNSFLEKLWNFIVAKNVEHCKVVLIEKRPRYCCYRCAFSSKKYDIFNSCLDQHINRYLTPKAPISKSGQTHSNNSSVNCLQIVWVCLTILWNSP